MLTSEHKTERARFDGMDEPDEIRDMRRFSARATVVLAPLLLLFLVMNAVLAAAPDSYAAKRKVMEQAAPQAEIVVLGSSHAYYGIDSSHMGGGSANLSHVGQSLAYDKLLLDKYAGAMPSLKKVIIPVSYFSLRYDLYESPDAWRTYFYEQDYGFPGPAPFWHLQRYIPLTRYTPRDAWALVVGTLLKKLPSDEFDRHGNLLNRSADSHDVQEGARLVAFYHGFMNEKYVDNNRATIATMARELGARGVEVCFVTTPVSRSYADSVDPAIYTEMVGTVEEVAAKSGARYLNYFDDPRFASDDFMDTDHLNGIGAEKFSRILAQDLSHQASRP